jgi:iron complex transport system substrate-binding protein
VEFRSISRLLLPLLLGLLLLAACGKHEVLSFDVSIGRVREAPQRIVALTPSLTETLFALGLGDRVVGVGDYTYWPDAAVRKPHLGGLFNPNLERLVSLHPDLAVLGPSERDLIAKLKPLKIDVLIVPNETLKDVESSFHTVAQACGVAAAGDKLPRARSPVRRSRSSSR